MFLQFSFHGLLRRQVLTTVANNCMQRVCNLSIHLFMPQSKTKPKTVVRAWSRAFRFPNTEVRLMSVGKQLHLRG